MKDVSITTKRFILKSLVPEHVTERYLSWLQNDVAKKYITYSKQKATLEELREYVDIRHESPDVLFLGIFESSQNEHIGNVKYEPVDRAKKRALMGIMIGDQAWIGKGVANEVIAESSCWLKENCQIESVFLGVDVSNESAIAAYKKTGFSVQKIEGYTESENQIFMEWKL